MTPTNQPDELQALYEVMAERGLVTTKGEFSREWCERAPNFLGRSSRNHTDRDLLIRLAKKLLSAGHADLAVTAVIAGLRDCP